MVNPVLYLRYIITVETISIKTDKSIGVNLCFMSLFFVVQVADIPASTRIDIGMKYLPCMPITIPSLTGVQ